MIPHPQEGGGGINNINIGPEYAMSFGSFFRQKLDNRMSYS